MTTQMYHENTPASVRNAKGLLLLTENTPNGQQVQILLEELATAYDLEWTTTLMSVVRPFILPLAHLPDAVDASDTSTDEQKQDWFLTLNPNGRIPVIIDNTQTIPFAVMEISAELVYLLKFDQNNYFGFDDVLEQSEALQWLFFWHGGGAPYQGNLGFFSRAKEQSSFAINRFRKETYRVFGVLEIRLSGKFTGEPRDYLVGEGKGKYSVSDIGAWAWVKGWSRSGFTVEEMTNFPYLIEWIDRIAKRPAVQRGISSKYT